MSCITIDILSDSEMMIQEIIGSIAFIMSASGCIFSLRNCLKIQDSDPFINMVFQIAIWDFFFIIAQFVGMFITHGSICNIQNSTGVIFFNFSLSCNSLISALSLVRTLKEREKFRKKHKLWLFILYMIVLGFAVLFYFIGHHVSNVANTLIFSSWSTVLVGFICFSNLKTVYDIKSADFVLENKAPIYLSMTVAVVFIQTSILNWMTASDDLFFKLMVMASNTLGLLIGFFNFIFSNKKVKEHLNPSENLIDRNTLPSVGTISITHFHFESNLAASIIAKFSIA